MVVQNCMKKETNGDQVFLSARKKQIKLFKDTEKKGKRAKRKKWRKMVLYGLFECKLYDNVNKKAYLVSYF